MFCGSTRTNIIIKCFELRKSSSAVTNYQDGQKSEAKGDFAISLEAMVEAGINTGYLAQVKRAADGKTK